MPTRKLPDFPQAKVVHILAHNPLFSRLSQDSLGRLAQAARRTDWHKDQPLNQAGGTLQGLHLVIAGLLKRTMISVDGEEKVLELVGPTHWCGLAELLGDNVEPVLTVAAEPSILLSLDAAAVGAVAEREPGLALRFARELANRQIALENEIVARQSRSAHDRILTLLLGLARHDPASHSQSRVELPTSKQLLASRIGLTPETFSRALRDLGDAGLIVNHGRSLIIRNAALALYRQSRQPPPAGQRRGERKAVPAVPLAAIVNIAGRQRMLAVRMAKAWLMLGHGVAPLRARAMLRQSVALFENQRLLLRAYPRWRGALEPLRAAEAAWDAYRELLENAPPETGHAALIRANDSVVRAADRLAGSLAALDGNPGCGLVNLAGRQRMLAQRLARLHICLHWDIDAAESRAALAADRAEFVAALGALETAAAASAPIRKQLAEVRRQWEAMRRMLDRPPARGDDGVAAAISLASERLVRELDQAVSLFEDFSPPG